MTWNQEKTKKIKDVFAWDRAFIFEYLPNAIQDFELWTEEEGQYMDTEYLGKRSAEKPLSSLTERYVVDDEISDENLHKLAKLIYAKYHRNWEQFRKYNDADYDIWDDVEKTTREVRGNDLQTPTDWKTISSGNDNDNAVEVENRRYGENSEDGVPTDTSISKSKSKIETEQSGTYKVDHYEKEVLDRKGSSKLRTGAEMMEFDLRFWDKWSFIDEVFKDVDETLCADYYDSDTYFL